MCRPGAHTCLEGQMVGGEVVGLVAWARRRWLFVGAVVAIVVAVVVVVWPGRPGPYVPPVRARVYSSRQACLLTDSEGISSAAAAPVWSGMQSASAQNSEMVMYVAVAGPPTNQNVQSYVSTLATRQCDVIVVVGAPEVQAVASLAADFPGQRFIVVGSVARETNVSVVTPGAASSVETAVRSDLLAG